jgi:hypothetical protein
MLIHTFRVFRVFRGFQKGIERLLASLHVQLLVAYL